MTIARGLALDTLRNVLVAVGSAVPADVITMVELEPATGDIAWYPAHTGWSTDDLYGAHYDGLALFVTGTRNAGDNDFCYRRETQSGPTMIRRAAGTERYRSIHNLLVRS